MATLLAELRDRGKASAERLPGRPSTDLSTCQSEPNRTHNMTMVKKGLLRLASAPDGVPAAEPPCIAVISWSYELIKHAAMYVCMYVCVCMSRAANLVQGIRKGMSNQDGDKGVET